MPRSNGAHHFDGGMGSSRNPRGHAVSGLCPRVCPREPCIPKPPRPTPSPTPARRTGRSVGTPEAARPPRGLAAPCPLPEPGSAGSGQGRRAPAGWAGCGPIKTGGCGAQPQRRARRGGGSSRPRGRRARAGSGRRGGCCCRRGRGGAAGGGFPHPWPSPCPGHSATSLGSPPQQQWWRCRGRGASGSASMVPSVGLPSRSPPGRPPARCARPARCPPPWYRIYFDVYNSRWSAVGI